MNWVIGLAALLAGCFGFVLLFGAPYLPTLTPQVEAALDAAELKPGEHLLELGSGDGKVLIAAARRGYRVTGYELNPLLAAWSWIRTRRHRHLVTVRCADFWRSDWPAAAAVFTFLLPKFMPRLDTKITRYAEQQGRSIRLVSFAFTIPERVAAAEIQGVYVYDYPAVKHR